MPRHVTLFMHRFDGLSGLDDHADPVFVVVRPPDCPHYAMVEEGYQRLRDAYPEAHLHWYRMTPLDPDDVYVE